MKATAEHLSGRIERGIENSQGRYDFASKVEVKAYVDKQIKALADATLAGMTTVGGDLDRTRLLAGFNSENLDSLKTWTNREILFLRNRVAELELPWYRRLVHSLRSPR